MTSDKSYTTEARLNALFGGNSWSTLGGIGGPSGWTSDHGRFRPTLDGETEFDFMLHGTSGNGTAGTITYANQMTPPPAYDRIYPLGANSTTLSAFVHIDTSGNVTLIVPAVSKIGGNVRMPPD